jgi:hypothetical protein
MPFARPATAWIWPLALAETMIVAGLCVAMLPAAIYGAAVPPRPRRVDGQRATEEYARANGLATK